MSTKTAKTLLASQTLAAAAAVNTTEWSAITAYGGMLGIKLTNGASAPTTAPVVKIYIGESTGTKRLFYTASGDVVNSSVNDIVCEIPTSVMFINVTITNGATNPITAEVYGQELTTV